MDATAVKVPCPACRVTSLATRPGERRWDCPNCGEDYLLRTCRSCLAVSHVTVLQQGGVPWTCVWCGQLNPGFRRRDPEARTVGDLAASVAQRGLAFPPQPASDEDAGLVPGDGVPVLIVTMDQIPGYRITEVHGDVFGLIVRSRGYAGNLGASLATVAGGEVRPYTELLTRSRDQARARMWRAARARGANAVVAMRFNASELAGIMTEVAAYGTAVTAERLPAGPDREAPGQVS